MRLAVKIDPEEVARWLGGMGHSLEPGLEARLEEAVAAASRIVAPTGVWRRFPVACSVSDADGEGGAATGSAGATDQPPCPIRLEGCALELPGYDIARHLAGASSVAAMAVTVGLEADREYRRRALRSALDALLFSTAAAVAAECAADELNELIVAQAGCRATARYSPGYGDLPLSVHPAFLAALDAPRQLGLTVADSGLLVPTKSITAVIGLFDGECAAPAATADSFSSAAHQPCAPDSSSNAAAVPDGCTGCPNAGRCVLAAAGKMCGRASGAQVG